MPSCACEPQTSLKRKYLHEKRWVRCIFLALQGLKGSPSSLIFFIQRTEVPSCAEFRTNGSHNQAITCNIQ
eukprot:1903666-Rhodomonas_salina.1